MAVANKPTFVIKTPPREDYIYEDDKCIVFDEYQSPQAMVHFLVVPKQIIPRFTATTDKDEEALGYLILVANKLAIQKGLAQTGFHVIVDEDFNKKRLKSLHVFGRALQHMVWPMGPGCRI